MKYLGPALLVGGGLVAGTGLFLALRKSGQTTDALKDAVDATPVPLPPSPAVVGKLPTFDVRLTGYWPYQSGLSSDERKMEGGTNDRKGKPIITLEMHQRDPVKYPYVSVAGDYNIFPYGQRIIVSAWPNLVFRVVDTGGHFFGAGKLYRVVGREPLDIAVDSSKTDVPKTGITAKIVPGDNFEKGKAVATAGLKDQTVSLTGEILEARTVDDYEALARALESELGGHPDEELVAAAWVIRNRAKDQGVSVKDLLAPGEYGPVSETGGYVSTRRVPNDRARKVADAVLAAHDVEDPTGGAVDYWVPQQQQTMRECGDVHRAALRAGDDKLANRFAKFANYVDEDTARKGLEKDGFSTSRVVGSVETLRRTS